METHVCIRASVSQTGRHLDGTDNLAVTFRSSGSLKCLKAGGIKVGFFVFVDGTGRGLEETLEKQAGIQDSAHLRVKVIRRVVRLHMWRYVNAIHLKPKHEPMLAYLGISCVLYNQDNSRPRLLPKKPRHIRNLEPFLDLL